MDFDNHTRFLPSAVEINYSNKAFYKNMFSHMQRSTHFSQAWLNKVPGSIMLDRNEYHAGREQHGEDDPCHCGSAGRPDCLTC
jgi:hypothetical protein